MKWTVIAAVVGYLLPASVVEAQRKVPQVAERLIDPFDFSWDHPLVQSRLWEGRNKTSAPKHLEPRRIVKRTTITGQQIGGKHCLGCAGGMQPPNPTISDLTTEFLENWILKSDSDLRNKCVFYTGITRSETPLWSLDSEGNRKGLSKTATAFSCNKGMYSIWQLWPGATGNVQPGLPPDTTATPNFWEVFEPGSWLNPIEPNRFTYFENMSRAMARHCKGRVWVMSLRPRELTSYGKGSRVDFNDHSIWNNVELPALRAHGDVTELIGIQATGGNGEVGDLWRLDFNDADLKALGRYTGTIPREVQELIGKRDTCTSNVAYEPGGEDWFGYGGKI